MIDRVLFAGIGILLFSITGVGVSAAVQHPNETAALVPAAIDVVEEAVVGATGTTVHTVAAVFNREKDTETDISNTPREDTTSTSAQNDIQISTPGREDEDEDEEEWEDENEDENEDEDEGEHKSKTTASPSPTTAPQNNTQTTAPSGVRTFTMQEIAAHASASSCYSAIGGSVYDLTSFVSRHPGGSAAIKSLCGVDGTAAFNAQHGGAGRPASELASLKIGVLGK